MVGSRVIGQEFKGRGYFQPRPSVTGYDASYTYFNNLGPNNRELSELFEKNLAAYAKREGVDPGDVPEDAVQTTASGVDPHISEENARIQARRVARQRNLPLARVGADRRAHRRPLAGRARRAGRERARAEPGAGGGGQVNVLDAGILRPALLDSLRKLDPRHVVRNPVMFVVEVGALITTAAWVIQVFGGEPLGGGDEPTWFTFTVALWLWLTVVFGNLAEALAEGRGKAQAESLRSMRTETVARLRDGGEKPAGELLKGDLVVVEAGELIPGDGTVIEGIASVDESAITGESAPVVRESGGDRSAVTGGTRVLSDRIVVEITQEPGKSFLDQMIALVEGAERRKTPNEIALGILLSGLTIVFLAVVVTLRPFAEFASTEASIATLIALLVSLIPTTIGALLSAIGIAGMDRLVRRNVLALSGRAVEASGDVDVLLLDKTGTITLGNREATEFIPMPGVSEGHLAEIAQFASLADETPEGRSIVVLAKQYGIRERELDPRTTHFVPFTAETRMSGVDLNGSSLRKGAGDAVISYIEAQGGHAPPELAAELDRIGNEGGTPLAVARDSQVLGVVYLKDIVKDEMSVRFEQLRSMGIRTVMVTGDNRLTAAKIAEEAGVDDFLPEATPEQKMELIRKEQAEGRLVAMAGDGTNDAPALAQSDVGVAMNTGTQAAREAGNMVDLDSNPTKLIEIVEIGKQLLITRGALTTFSIANDVAKYFAILPAIFAASYAAAGQSTGPLDDLNVMALGSPESAIISAIIFNALIIPALVPLALRGVATGRSAHGPAAAQHARVRPRRPDRAVRGHQADRPPGPQRARRLAHEPTWAARCSPVSVEPSATRSAGVPSNTTRPPSWPAPGPRSMIQSACAMTAWWCSMTITDLPESTSRSSRPSSCSTSARWRPVVGSSRT